MKEACAEILTLGEELVNWLEEANYTGIGSRDVNEDEDEHIHELESYEAVLNKIAESFGWDVERQNFALLDRKLKLIEIPGSLAFKLYDTYGFPLDLTELMARERGFSVDVKGFEELMEDQRERARAAQKKEIITVEDVFDYPTEFVGYDKLEANGKILIFVSRTNQIDEYAVVDTSPFYAEMGGQVGDTGKLIFEDGQVIEVLNTTKRGNTFYLKLLPDESHSWTPLEGIPVKLVVDAGRRNAIQRHHTVTHLLHWALHEVVSHEATQKGLFVGPDKLTFDFNSAALTHEQVRDIEKLVNERIVENAGVSWTEMPYAEVKSHADVMQFFGDKYGDTVRVVQIGGRAGSLDGYSMELCGGTHTRATGEIGLFRIVSEAAIAAGVRRIEAVAGLHAWEVADVEKERLKTLAAKLNAPLGEVEKKLDVLLAQQKELEKELEALHKKQAAATAQSLIANSSKTINGTPAIINEIKDAGGDVLQSYADAIVKQLGFKGVVVLGSVKDGSVALVASVSSDFTAKFRPGKSSRQSPRLSAAKAAANPTTPAAAARRPPSFTRRWQKRCRCFSACQSIKVRTCAAAALARPARL